jgi:site-specific recombinase XerD
VQALQQFINRNVQPFRNTHQRVEARPALSGFEKAHAGTAQSRAVSQLLLADVFLDILDRHLDPGSIIRNIVTKYGRATGIDAQVKGLCVHWLRATAATNALSHESDIAKVQEWLGHAKVSTTRLYDRRKSKPEDSPTFRVKY